jgi:hypothetical protein
MALFRGAREIQRVCHGQKISNLMHFHNAPFARSNVPHLGRVVENYERMRIGFEVECSFTLSVIITNVRF